MKTARLFLSGIIILTWHEVSSQYSFSVGSSSYQSIDSAPAINLTDSFVWNFGSDTVFTIPIGFDFFIAEEKFDSVRFNPVDAVISFYQQCNQPEGLISGPEFYPLLTNRLG